MNGGRSDASTSTDDIRGRPLCLFYFTHPFGVLSPDPPTIATAPDHISQAFINMEPVSPFNIWSPSSQESYNTAATSSSRVSYDLGNVMIPKKPISLVSVPKYTVDFGLRKDSVTSSLFSSDIWLSTSSSDARRVAPYNRILPPLKMPTPNLTDSSDDFWTAKSFHPDKFSLPPIDMPTKCKRRRRARADEVTSDGSAVVREVMKSDRAPARVLGVRKARRRVRRSGVRRMVTCLMQRVVKGRKEINSSPTIQEVLNTIREAWTEPKSLFERCRALTRNSNARESARDGDSATEGDTCATNTMLRKSQLAELPPRAGASPGMLRRRYSMPETIMRKYRLAQQRSDSDESVATTAPSRAASSASPSPPRGSCSSLCEPPHRFLRKDRELMRKSALLRRLWARPNCNPCPSCCYCNGDLYEPQEGCGRETRSLDGSRSELRHMSSSYTSTRNSRESHVLAGWSTPKRQKLELDNNFHGSDEMLRTAMRNSYDRAEELRVEKETREEMSDSTFQSHEQKVSSSDVQLTDSTNSDNVRNSEDFSDVPCSGCATAEVNSGSYTSQETRNKLSANTCTDDLTSTDTDSTFSTTMSTAKDTNGSSMLNHNKFTRQGHIDLHITEESENIENNEKNNIEEHYNPSKNKAMTYDILEIVVSETLNSSAFDQNIAMSVTHASPINVENSYVQPAVVKKNFQNIDLDEYVSNILVESLNSLTDQLESMNASIGSERKISIVEKEIKVKLQNTGVNTIVHLSPTSNNQIIFGNEELYNKEDNKDTSNNSNNIKELVTIREEVHSDESNNNFNISPRENRDCTIEENNLNENFEPTTPHDNVNKAVLQQIQKLFQDELNNIDSHNYPVTIPGISHVEISNVDVYIDENECESSHETTDIITLSTDHNVNHVNETEYNEQYQDMLSEIGPGNYYKTGDEHVLVPRFSAFPNSDSMEVNTSSSEDAEVIGSECTSLVDSLDDPNSPRSMLLRRSFNKRNELVRSAIDVLDLLPETAFVNDLHPKEKSEAFFIRIKDNDCDCEKENIIVADHMPEKIKQRLFRRHRKREIRMECARRKKVKQLKREIEKQRDEEVFKSKQEVESDCMAIVNALIDEVITKITQDEYKCMRIKQKTNNHINKNLVENQLITNKRNTWNKDINCLKNIYSIKATKNGTVYFCEENSDKDYNHNRHRKSRDRNQICGKLSLQAHPQSTPDGCGPKRIYQKSEFHDGNKCIEILEILEYVEGSPSSPETNSDENLSSSLNKHRKSKIPIPIYEKINKLPKNKNQKPYKSSPTLHCDKKYKSNRFITNMLLEALSDDGNEGEKTIKNKHNETTSLLPTRRASVPQQDTRSRSNSLRFKQMFDIIPEEKSSLSIESSSEDINYNRRVSAPSLTGNFTAGDSNNITDKTNADQEYNKDLISSKLNVRSISTKDFTETKSIGTSPLNQNFDNSNKSPQRQKNKSMMTSPPRKFAATSPIMVKMDKNDNCYDTNKSNAKKSLSPHGTRAGWVGFYKPNKQMLEEEGLKEVKNNDRSSKKDRKSKHVYTQHDGISNLQSTVRTIECEKTEPIIIGKDKRRMRNEKSQTRESKSKVDKKESNRKKAENLDKDSETNRQKRNRDNSRVSDLSDPQSNFGFDNNTDKTFKSNLVEEHEEEIVGPKSVKLSGTMKDKIARLSTSDSDSDSAKSLLCSLAPKWLSVGNLRQKRQVKKKPSQEQQTRQNSAGGWSVTVAGNCYTALPADVEMRLSFPPTGAQPAASQSDSGFGDDVRARKPIAAAPLKGCHCRHCEDCTCSNKLREEHSDSYPPILPPAARKMTMMMKKESSGSSILTTKSTKKSTDPLPDVETYKSSKSKSKSSLKMRRGYSLHCWLPGDAPQPPMTSNGLSVLGCAIIPEMKPRVPTMSEKDLTRIYTPRHYLRS